MHAVAPGVTIHTPLGGFDDLVPQQRSKQVEQHAPTVIDKINSDLHDINEAIDAAAAGMSDQEITASVRAHFKRMYHQFLKARTDLLAIRVKWREAAGDPWNEESLDTLKRLHAAGKQPAEIAQEMGYSRHKVRGKLRRLGLIGDKARQAAA